MNLKFAKSIALSAVFVFLPALAQAEPQVYGKLYMALDHINDDTEANSHWDLNSHASRFGIKGDFDTDSETLKVIYKLEWQVDVSDESNSSNDHIKSRNQYLGLEGRFGQLIAGRHDTPFKAAQGKVDQFNDGLLDIGVLMAGSENRESNIIQYTSPKIAEKVSLVLMVRPGEESNGSNNGVADASSLSIVYDSDAWYVTLAFDNDIDGEGVDAGRVVATWKHGNFGLGGLYQSTDWDNAGIYNDDEKVLVLSGYYKINKVMLKAQLGQTDNYGGLRAPLGEDNDSDYAAIGLDYSLSKKSTVGVYYGARNGGDKLAVVTPDVTSGLDVYRVVDRDVFGVSLIHSF